MSTTAASAITAAPLRAFDRAPLIPFWALVLGVGVARIAMYPFYGEAYVTSLLGKFLCYAIFALSIDLIWGFADPQPRPSSLFRHRRLFRGAVTQDQLRARAPDPVRRPDSGLHGMERPDRAADLHGTADQPAARYRRRADHADPACLPVRRDHLQTAYLRRVLRGHHPGRVPDSQDFIIEYQAYTGGFNGITDYSNYANIYFLWFVLAVTVLFFVAGRAFTHSRVGTILKSIRTTMSRRVHEGYVANYRIFVFCVSAFMAASAAPCTRPGSAWCRSSTPARCSRSRR